MNNPIQSLRTPRVGASAVLGGILLGLSLAAGASATVVPSGTISSSGNGPYNYSLTFSDAASATSPVGSVWYAWVPGLFFLPGAPSSPVAPPGWTASVSGHSVQYVANSPANYIAPGQSLSGFGYQATFTPAELAAARNSGESVAYMAGLFSDAGVTFTVQPVPEPSTLSFLAFGAGALGWLGR